MTVGPGTRVGPYEVSSLLGEGGMGKVWRARHTSLGRDDALKVLPDAFADDADRLRRFTREAQLLASLNHPYIAQVHGLEQMDGTAVLVMELVEGPTLADRIAGGAIPLDEALPIARQIAEALEAAHEQGIVHRDLKPANIKVRDDGTVKVLDFGLAKALGADAASAAAGSVSQAPTITSPAMTQVGMLLGTAAYMSPEQAKGREADRRSDIWAFGAVLYEMLTGTRVFPGEDLSETLAAVIKSEPDWTALPAAVPRPVRTLLERCLTKDRRARVSDAATALFVLREHAALSESRSGDAASAGTAASPPFVRRALPPAIAAAVTSVVVGVAAWTFWPVEPMPEVLRSSFIVPQEHQLVTARLAVAVSRDGSKQVYASANGLFLRSNADWAFRLVPGTDGGRQPTNPVFSPDGTNIAFVSNTGVARIGATGGVAIPVCRINFPTFGLTWDTSGVVFGGRGVFRCGLDGGAPEQLAKVAGNEVAWRPQILPGGQALIFTLAKRDDDVAQSGVDADWDGAQIVVQSLASGERRTLVNGGSDARYLPTGHLMYAVRGVVFAAPFDAVRLELLGEAVPVIEGVRRSSGSQFATAQFDVSDSGTLIYVPGPPEGESANRSLVSTDREGRQTRLGIPPGRYVHVRASRDGTRLAMDSDDGNEADVHIYELSGAAAPRRLTFGGHNRFPVWSSDGQSVAFQSDREGDRAIFVQRVDGSGLKRLTTPAKGEEQVPESWSPDGRHLSFATHKDGSYALWVLSVADGKAAPFGDVRSLEPLSSGFSPDGRWLAYHAQSSREVFGSVFVQPFPADGTIRQAPRVGRDFQPVWSQKGDELFYMRVAGYSGEMTVAQVQPGMTFGPPKSLPGAIAGGRRSSFTRTFDVLPDGRFVGLVSDVLGAGLSNPEIRVVVNWLEDVRRLLPPK